MSRPSVGDAYKPTRVAAGLCDAMWSRGPMNEWDVDAGVLQGCDNVSFYTVALATSILIFTFFSKFETIYKIKNVPPYLFLTGFISAFIGLGITFLIPKIGARKLFILSIAGRIVMAIIASHFGILKSPQDPITFRKIIGAILLFSEA